MTKMSLRNVEAAFAALLLAFATPTLAQETCPNPGDATNVDDRAMAHIRYLADDRLEGREVGTRGARCAADYIAAQQPVRDNVVVVVEQWESLEALNDHLVAPHMAEYRTSVKDLVVSTSLRVLEPLDVS